jgi:orotate phosphoribosyltransferase
MIDLRVDQIQRCHQPARMGDFKQEFLAFAIARGAISFGEFKTKAGRASPYFFNAASFNDGAALRDLTRFYAKALLAGTVEFDMLFGPAYKGIALVAGVAIALAEAGRNVGFAYNRKEAKDHGEGGLLVGAPLKGRVMIVDDVISAGTSVRESVDMIRAQGAQPAGVVIALDRMERGQTERSAVQEVEQALGLRVLKIATIVDLLSLMGTDARYAEHLPRVAAYRDRYGVA